MREGISDKPRDGVSPVAAPPTPLVVSEPALNSSALAACSFVSLGDATRVSFMLTATPGVSFAEQAAEVLSGMRKVLERLPEPAKVTSQTVFLRDASDQAACEQIFSAHYGTGLPVTNYVLQPPCSGAALALEAWAIAGKTVKVDRLGPHALAVHYNGTRLVYCAGIRASVKSGAYAQTLEALEQMRAALVQAGSGSEHMVRTWFYLGGITDSETGMERYRELNRARTDFYRGIRFGGNLADPNASHGIYPASTGIGMNGAGLVASCMTVQSSRPDARLLPLENPKQTPAYAYHPRHSPQSPKFARAMALVLGHYATTWVSGTASIVSSESRHLADIEGQTEQTIDNIQRLIAPENFSFHGVPGAGASLHDLAKIRVYLKRVEDYPSCKAICDRRFAAVPAIYAIADICRPELLVEIEGVAFSKYSPPERFRGPAGTAKP
jgi:enamine deaminase RidA (YjgF/YER057c/UK114 family)